MLYVYTYIQYYSYTLYTVIYTAVCSSCVCMRTTLVLSLVAIIHCVKHANMKSEYFLYVRYKIRSSKKSFSDFR